MSLATLRLQFSMVLATMALFGAMLVLNEWLFRRFEFAPGIHWVYLPAGMRLVCTLMFAEAGAVGLLLASWLVSFYWFFPHDSQRAFVGGIFASLAPYLVYLGARRAWGLESSLAQLSPGRLLLLAVACSIASPLVHHLWFALQGQPELLQSLTAMFVGDLLGTLIVLYTMKGLLSLLPRRVA